jgi:D-hydantoinase
VTQLAELVVRNARLVLPEGVVRGNLSVEGGCIANISKTEPPKGEQDIDVKGKLVMPGAIDAHVHFYDPNYTHRDDFEDGSRAAAAGGVTCVVVMPLDTPMLSPRDLETAIREGEKKSLIDFALHAGNMTPEAVGYIKADMELGVKTFKLFTCAPYGVDDPTLLSLMRSVNEAGGISFIHAEDDEILRMRMKELREAGRKDPLAHAESRPNEAEEMAVKRVLEHAREIGCRLHLAHITTQQGARLVEEAKNRGAQVTAETCPHYLLFRKEDMREKGPYLRVNPALKSKADIPTLWKALARGAIDILATDHAPGTKEEKEVGWEDIWKAQIGIPGVETLLPLMLSEGLARGRLTLERLVDALSTRPAKIFGLYPRKGVIRVGSDADLVVVDPKGRARIEAKRLHYKVGWTPYEGMEVKGVPVMTISRGVVIAEEGEVPGKPGRGQFLPAR